MTEWFVHAAFYPRLYVLLGLGSLTIGMSSEVGSTTVRRHRFMRDVPKTAMRQTVAGPFTRICRALIRDARVYAEHEMA